MKVKYLLLIISLSFATNACGRYIYYEDGYTVLYYSKYEMVADKQSLYQYSKYRLAEEHNYISFKDKYIVKKQDLPQHKEYFKVFYNDSDIIEQIKHYKYNMLTMIRHNDRIDGRLIRLERYSEGQLLGYYVNYYNDHKILTQRRHFNTYDRLEKVEKFE